MLWKQSFFADISSLALDISTKEMLNLMKHGPDSLLNIFITVK